MAEKKKINWILNIQVEGGPRISISKDVEIEAYDVIEVMVPKKGKAVAGIQPNALEDVRLVSLRLKNEAHYSGEVSYSVHDDVTDAKKRIKLDAAQFLVGSGAVGLLGNIPDKLFFYNSLDNDVDVQVLVGRIAITK